MKCACGRTGQLMCCWLLAAAAGDAAVLFQVPAWRPESFLANLDPAALPPALTARLSGNAATAAACLYGAFIESPNFAFWFQQRRAPVLHLVEDEVCLPEQGVQACVPPCGVSRVGYGLLL
jgi:hypothetical protein